MSNHSSIVYDGFMYLFGGSGGSLDNTTFYKLDLTKYVWTIIKPKALDNDKSNFPNTRDEHSCAIYNDSMVVFGGFANGERTNEIFQYHFKTNQWEKHDFDNHSAPCPRVGHSAVIRFDA